MGSEMCIRDRSSDVALRLEGYALRLADTQSAWLSLGMDVSP